MVTGRMGVLVHLAYINNQLLLNPSRYGQPCVPSFLYRYNVFGKNSFGQIPGELFRYNWYAFPPLGFRRSSHRGTVLRTLQRSPGCKDYLCVQ